MPGPVLAGTGEALDASLNTMITEFYRLRDEIPKLKDYTTKFTLAPHSGRSKVILDYGRLIARDLSDGVDITEAQDLSDAQTAYSPNEVGLKVILPRTTVRRVADPDLMRQTGRMMAAAYYLKEDTDIANEFDSFTTATLGAAGTVLSPGLISAGVAGIRVGNNVTTPEPAPEPYFGIFHPCSIHSVANRIIPLTDVPVGTNVYVPTAAGATVGPGRTAFGDQVLQQGSKAIGTLAGATIVTSANIPVDASNDAEGVVCSREGLIYVSEFEPMEETQDDVSLRGKELVFTGSYVAGVHRPLAFGITVTCDAVLPTA
jgi:hypothetical protein